MNVAKNIVLFVDGTWNSEEAENQTNVRKLFDITVYDEAPPTPQVSYYLPGVGTDIKGSVRGDPIGFYKPCPTIQKYAGDQAHALSRKFLGGALGDGTTARIKEAYAFLCTEYNRERGDKVFLFGFSRGAFAARSLAGFIDIQSEATGERNGAPISVPISFG